MSQEPDFKFVSSTEISGPPDEVQLYSLFALWFKYNSQTIDLQLNARMVQSGLARRGYELERWACPSDYAFSFFVRGARNLVAYRFSPGDHGATVVTIVREMHCRGLFSMFHRARLSRERAQYIEQQTETLERLRTSYKQFIALGNPESGERRVTVPVWESFKTAMKAVRVSSRGAGV